MRILLAGRGILGYRLLQALLKSPHEVVGVIQCTRPRASRPHPIKCAVLQFLRWRDPLRACDPLRLAKRHSLPVFPLDRMTSEELRPLRSLKPDLIAVASFPLIFRQELLDLPRLGCLNTHPSLLPRFRGPNPYTRVILAREAETGVTFHRMDKDIDTGDILEQARFPLAPDETYLSLQRKTAEAAFSRLPALLERIARDGLGGKPQEQTGASYQGPLKESELFIPWEKRLEEIEPLFRALEPCVYPRFRYRGHAIRVVSAAFTPGPPSHPPGTFVISKKPVTIAAGDGVLAIRSAYTGASIPIPWPYPGGAPRAGDPVEQA